LIIVISMLPNILRCAPHEQQREDQKKGFHQAGTLMLCYNHVTMADAFIALSDRSEQLT
jgi:hypothetical protein